MRVVPFVLIAMGCEPEKPEPVDPTGDPPTDVEPEETPDTTPSSTSTSTSTPTTPSTPTTTPPPPASQPPVPCPWPVDEVVLASCAATGDAAWVGTTGHADVQQAVDAASPGETITVCPGSWPGNVTIGDGKILAAADPTPGVTALDGGGVDWLVQARDATIRGLTLRRGHRAAGGAAVWASGDVLLECVVADDNVADGAEPYGGAVLSDGTLTVRYGSFHHNGSRYAGGAVSATDLVVEDTSFTENAARYEGGGIYTDRSVVVRRSDFSDNEAGYEGAGISGTGTFDIEDSTFSRNDARYEGGAVSIGGRDPSRLTVTRSAFDENTAGNSGGAIQIGSWSTDPTVITDSTFVENQSGGIAAVDVGTWGGVDLTITGCTFAANLGIESGALGSGGWLLEGGTITLTGTVFEDNVATGNDSGGVMNLWSENGPVALGGTDLSVLRNSGTAGALWLGGAEHVLTCTNCDFGTGADDNVPGDATKDGVFTAELGLDFVL